MHMFAAPSDISKRAPGIKPELASLINRLLAKTAAERPTMAQVHAELSALTGTGLADGPLEQRPSILRSKASIVSLDGLGPSGMIRQQLALVPGAKSGTATTSGGEVSQPISTRRSRWSVALPAALALLVLSAVGWTMLRHRPPLATPATAHPPGPALPTAPVSAVAPATPDGGAAAGAQDPAKPPALAGTTTGEPAEPAASAKDGKRVRKSSRKSGRGSKNGKYQIELWQ